MTGTVLKRAGERSAAALDQTLRRSTDALAAALDSGGDCLPDQPRQAASAVIAKAAGRLSVTGPHTVVALAGATGSGKSSLFNRLAGADVADVGARRPTTSRISAAVWGREDASGLLDWLGVPVRHRVEPGGGERPDPGLDGLVLLDLPDFDSDVPAHRAEADRVLSLADAFVWVTDPQKYADALLHDQYLAAARHHEAVTLVVLNQADRMRPQDARSCRADLARLLEADGLRDVGLFLVSAVTGEGIGTLTEALRDVVSAATAARVRLLGDIRREAESLRRHVGDSEPTVGDRADAGLVDALSRAAGVPVVLGAVEKDHRRRGVLHTGWLFGRWVQALRPDPLRRVALRPRKPSGRADASGDDLDQLLRRSSLPQAPPAARAAVDLATRRLAANASASLPPLWALAAERAAVPDRTLVADDLDQAIVSTKLPVGTPVWWWLFNALQWVCALAVLGGVVWTAATTLLQLPVPDSQRIGLIPMSIVLVAAGLLLGLGLAVLARPLVAAGARRRRRAAGKLLADRVSEVAAVSVLGPVREVLDRHARTRERLQEALGR